MDLDANYDGEVTADDVTYILQVLVGLIPP
jgi:hypothetical protein